MKKDINKEIHKIPLFDQNGKKKDSFELDKDLFDGKFSEGLLYQSIVSHRANQRRGTASTKTRRDVRGGGKKPWKQKGTGRARVRSIRNPIWRGGGVVYGPHPRDFGYRLPKKVKRGAFLASLNAKLKDKELAAIESITLTAPKTRELAGILKGLNIKGTILLLVDNIDKNLHLAGRNMNNLTLKNVNGATAYDVLSCAHVLITKKAIEQLNNKGKK